MDYKFVELAGIQVAYRSHLNGGGTLFGRDVARVVQNMSRPTAVLEWCSGPGFIGFDLLGRGLCDQLWLADINPEAIEAARQTISNNELDGKVAALQSDGLSALSRDLRFDLVVGNPPHSGTDVLEQGRGTELVYQDIGWAVHHAFYSSVHQFLNPGASVLIQENLRDSSTADFVPMIEAGGLRVIDTLPCTYPGWENQIYYIWSQLDESSIR